MTTGSIHEVFSSYQGEGGSVRGSCMGRRQIFVRFAGCNLAQGSMGTGGCVYCDSLEAARGKAPYARIESHPGKGDFGEVRNPVPSRLILKAIGRLMTPDVHSVSFTGGEPLCQPELLKELAEALRGEGRRTYLETNGSLPVAAEEVASAFDLACVDFKDRSACASAAWEELLHLEIRTVKALLVAGAETFAKLVVTKGTRPVDVETISKMLQPLSCDLAIQIVTPMGGVRPPAPALLFDMTEAAAKHLQPQRVSISAQVQRMIGIR